jgi:hypothetical protein
MFLRTNYNDTIKHTYIRSRSITGAMTREKKGLLAFPLTTPVEYDVFPVECASPYLCPATSKAVCRRACYLKYLQL